MKSLLLFLMFFYTASAKAQNVGIGTSTPFAKLHIVNNFEGLRLQGLNNYLSFYDGAGAYTGYLWNRNNNSMDLGTPNGSNFPVYISPNTVTQATFHPNGNLGLGITDPVFRLDVLGRIRLRFHTESAGLWLNNTLNTASPAFIGMVDDNRVGFYGNTGGGWMFYQNTNTGLATFTNTLRAARFQYNTPQVHYYSIGYDDLRTADGFIPKNNIDDWYWTPWFSATIYRGLSGPLHLPDGAVVTNITITAYDNSSTEDLLVFVSGRSNTGGAEVGLCNASTSGTPGYISISPATIPSPVINNQLYNYGIYVNAMPNWSNDNVRIKSILITYTMDGPL